LPASPHRKTPVLAHASPSSAEEQTGNFVVAVQEPVCHFSSDCD
jgi:hypothetical protein